jgi:hypothetical protein
MIRAGRDADLLGDRLDDRVGRDRAGQSLEDPGQALGLPAPADLEAVDGVPVQDRGQADDGDEPGEDEVDRAGALRGQPEEDEQAEDEERDGEEPPRLAQPPLVRLDRC